MSERDPSEPKTHKRRKNRRRSLRVPVDEVPRPTQAAGALDDGGATMEIPAFDDSRASLEDIGRATLVEPPLDEPPLDESVETELIEETDVFAPDESDESDLLDDDDESAADAEAASEEAVAGEADGGEADAADAGPAAEEGAAAEGLLGAPREDADEPLAAEPTVVQEPPSEAPAVAGQADAVVDDAPSVEVDLGDGDDEGDDEAVPLELLAKAGSSDTRSADASDTRASSEPSSEARASEARSSEARSSEESATPEPASSSEPPPKAVVLGVVVQRVVSVVSAPRSSPPPPYEPEESLATDTQPGTEVAVDVDDEDEPDLSVTEGGDLEDLDVDLDDGEEAQARRRDSAPELPTEEAEELLEEEAAAEEGEGSSEAPAKKRPSKRPPPPPTNKGGKDKDAPPPPPEPEPAKAAPPRRKKVRKAWYEELFNDDYLRTVPIPHPRVIDRQCDFIEQRFGLAKGATILDVGCGLGLHAVELTRRGYLVVGLDLSLPMLSRAADEAQDHGFKINFLHADMREMNFDGAFDAVLCWGTTLGYFDDETNKQVVDRLYRALKPRGLLLLDVVNRDYLIRSQPNLVWFEGDGCVVMEESRMNYITSRLEVKRTVILDDGRQRDNVYSLRTFSLHELGQILHHQGFRVVEVTGWEAHPGVFFGADSPKLMILAERRPSGPPSVPGRTPSGEMQALGSEPAAPPEAGGEPPDLVMAEEALEPIAAAEEERPEPSDAVSEALAETLERSGELEVQPERDAEDDAEDLDPAEIDDDDLEEE